MEIADVLVMFKSKDFIWLEIVDCDCLKKVLLAII